MLLSEGQMSDYKGAALMIDALPKAKAMLSDRGYDTMTGGTDADIFHSSSDAAIDRVLDFSVAQGDRMQLEPGTTYTMAQVGADTVITMSAGSVALVGVSMSGLLGSSVFVG